MKKTIFFSWALAMCIFLLACNGSGTKDGTKNTNKPQDEKLMGFMLGGVYFIQGYGGQNAVNNMITTSDKDEVIANYKELLEFPFKPEDGAGAKQTLDNWWGIKDKAGVIKTFDKLKAGDAENPHRAWDYARLVNNACMAYATGYLTKDETAKYVAEVLPMAKKDFKTWDDYYKDFMQGRRIWDKEEAENKTYENVIKEMMVGEKSIYQLVPLN